MSDTKIHVDPSLSQQNDEDEPMPVLIQGNEIPTLQMLRREMERSRMMILLAITYVGLAVQITICGIVDDPCSSNELWGWLFIQLGIVLFVSIHYLYYSSMNVVTIRESRRRQGLVGILTCLVAFGMFFWGLNLANRCSVSKRWILGLDMTYMFLIAVPHQLILWKFVNQ